MDKLSLKLNKLERRLQEIGPCAIAFSGGVDSAFLAAFALKVLSDKPLAVTAISEFLSKSELTQACRMATFIGLDHEQVKAKVMEHPEVVENGKNRCYHCKQLLFSIIFKLAKKKGFSRMIHGVNLDDLDDFRPGLIAAREMGVLSPLVDAELTKVDIRRASREIGLETWDLPSQACLASRIPYGERITENLLQMIENGEAVLKQAGFYTCRLRVHGNVARIELDPQEMPKALAFPLRINMVDQLKKLGFQYVALDMEGYVSGSMNKGISVSTDSLINP